MAISQPYSNRDIDQFALGSNSDTRRPSYHNVNHPSIVSKWLNSGSGTALRNPTDAVSRRQNKFFQLSSSLFGDNAERQKVRQIGEQNFKRQLNESLAARKIANLRSKEEENRIFAAMSVPGLSNLESQSSLNSDPFAPNRIQSTFSNDQPSYSGINSYGSQPTINYGNNFGSLPSYDTQGYASNLNSYQPSFHNNDIKRSNSFDYSPTTWSDANSPYRTDGQYTHPYQYQIEEPFGEDIHKQLKDQQTKLMQQLQKENFEAKKALEGQQRMRDRLDEQIIDNNFQRQQQRVRKEFEDEQRRKQDKEDMFQRKREAHHSRLENLTRQLHSAKLVNGGQTKLPEISLNDTISLMKNQRITEGLRDERPLHQKRNSNFSQPQDILRRGTGINYPDQTAITKNKNGGRRASVPQRTEQYQAAPSLAAGRLVSDRPPNPFFDKTH